MILDLLGCCLSWLIWFIASALVCCVLILLIVFGLIVVREFGVWGFVDGFGV